MSDSATGVNEGRFRGGLVIHQMTQVNQNIVKSIMHTFEYIDLLANFDTDDPCQPLHHFSSQVFDEIAAAKRQWCDGTWPSSSITAIDTNQLSHHRFNNTNDGTSHLHYQPKTLNLKGIISRYFIQPKPWISTPRND